jgi:hypothetical protein
VAGSFRPDTVAGRVSWPLSSFLVIAVVLAAGWVAYERSRPSARMTATVAVMAAIAALGRDAFAALPDVKPITAITLVVGYSLGPLPGFTVGAIGMLVSNFMFGQGSYTPWQMAAWGTVGLAGGALGALSSRRLGRLPLALACAATALCAKEVMNLYTWTPGGVRAGRRRGTPVRCHRHHRELPFRPRIRPRAGRDASPHPDADGGHLGSGAYGCRCFPT